MMRTMRLITIASSCFSLTIIMAVSSLSTGKVVAMSTIKSNKSPNLSQRQIIHHHKHHHCNVDQQRRRQFLSYIATVTTATFSIQPFFPSSISSIPLISNVLTSQQNLESAFAYETSDSNSIDEELSSVFSSKRRDFPYNDNWKGTSLTLLSISAAASFVSSRQQQLQQQVQTEGDESFAKITFPMGRWPDPMLRRPANSIPNKMLNTNELKIVAETLRDTARVEGAVGLAAQQCGIDGSMFFLDDITYRDNNKRQEDENEKNQVSSHRKWLFLLGNTQSSQNSAFFTSNGESKMVVMGEGDTRSIPRQMQQKHTEEEAKDGGIFLVNPRILSRSSEVDMNVWTEQCLVLPPDFTATVLRDSLITVEYETLEGQTRTIQLEGELSRAAQHEMDHDRGVLILDHVSLDEMSNDIMRMLESRGHEERMLRAYERYISDPMTA
mmetsp:Transcript_31668/g.47202  ORF Transcript_31668/g.47202 Transcript_31668/m.47202 type:complete len:440 (-) Transcript_31668:115-1434(-)